MGFWSRATEDPGHLALVEPDGTEHKAGDLLAEANRLAHGLRAAGVGKGDVVATLLPNSAAMVEVYLAALQIGAYLTPINFHLTGPEIAHILSDSEAKILFLHERFAPAALAGADEAGTRAAGDVEFLKRGQPSFLPDERAAGGTMHYTSGTTGKPKGVRRPLAELDPDTYADMYASFGFLFGIEPGGDAVHLAVSPMYHTAVLTFSTNSLNSGHTVVLMDKWSPQDTLELIERHRVTTSHMVPTQFHRLLALPAEVRERYDVSSLRQVIHSAAPCPVDVKRRMLEWWGPVIYEYYAATEGGGTVAPPDEWLRKPGTVGRAWPGAEIKVLDDDGNELAPGEVGTVYMGMAGVSFEYHKDREKTEKSFRGGIFTVGDAGYLDEDGYLFLCDRKSDMIISGGVNIYPAEIESVLLMHPEVADAGVFGIPHEDWGEEVKAAIEPADGVEAGADLEQEIIEFCAERLARYKLPRSIDFHASLPRDPNGKLYKRKLRDPYWEGRERLI